MLESINTTELEFKPLTPEEKSSRGILGRLSGPIASCVKATRNGRKYTDNLWKKAFDSPIVKEMFANGGLPGELNHPTDRSETDATKIAIMMPEPPKKNKDGHLVASVDILDTPCGRIAYQLAKYGFKFGISSRGEGDVEEDWNGEEVVDPSSYTLEAFDLVLLPAVKTARLSFTESLDTHKKTLKTALMEALEKSTEDEQKVMKETLDELCIDYTADEESEKDSDSVNNIDVATEDVAANDDGADIMKELQEALQRQQELEVQVKTLQEKLSVCYTKESRYSDKLGKANSKVAAQETENKILSEQLEQITTENHSYKEMIEELNATVNTLTESLNKQKNDVEELNSSLSGYRSKYAAMQKKVNESTSNKKTLDESLNKKSAEVTKLTEAYSKLQESAKKQLEEAVSQRNKVEAQNKIIVEELQELKKDSQILKSQNNAKLDKAQHLVEKYKTVAKTAVDKYINSQAKSIGVSSADIKLRLNESYSFKDIDKAVEDLKQYKLNLNSLPFTTMSPKKNIKMQIRESKDPLLEMKDANAYHVDDELDETLLSFAN